MDSQPPQRPTPPSPDPFTTPKPIVITENQQEVEREKVWDVILWNDEMTPFALVVVTIAKAAGCSLEVAEAITREVHFEGMAIVMTTYRTKAEKVAGAIRVIGVKVTIERAD